MPQEQKKDYDPTAYKPRNVKDRSKRGFWRTFFMVLGIIFAIAIIMVIGAIIALAIIKPFGIDVMKMPSAYLEMKSDAPSSYDHPLLSTEQEKFLDSMGVDPSILPTEITPAQEACAVSTLGQARVDEIKAGALPTISDYLKAKTCLE